MTEETKQNFLFLGVVVLIVVMIISFRSNQVRYYRLTHMPIEKEKICAGRLPQIKKIHSLNVGDVILATKGDTIFLDRVYKPKSYYLCEIYELKDNQGHKWIVYEYDGLHCISRER